LSSTEHDYETFGADALLLQGFTSIDARLCNIPRGKIKAS